MERISVSEAGRHFGELIDRVSTHGITVELERDKRVIARISPVGRCVKVADLNRIFAGLPSLGDEAESFANDLERLESAVRPETDPWVVELSA